MIYSLKIFTLKVIKVSLIFITLLAISQWGYCQDGKNISIGISTSLQFETTNQRLPNQEASYTSFFGHGIRIQKKLNPKWEVAVGVNYVKRQYNVLVPFDHCYFSETSFCLDYLAWLNNYGYSTFELPIGIMRQIITKDKWGLYIGCNVITAIDFQSFYNPRNYVGEHEIKRIHEIRYFSSSLTGNLGVSFLLTDKIKLNTEPFLRIVHNQRENLIIMRDQTSITYLDNFGIHFTLLYQF